MHHLKDQTTHLSLISLLFIALLALLFLVNPNDPSFFKPISAVDPLGAALAGAATADSKTLIIAVVNKAYVEEGDRPMFEIFLDGFWLGDGTRELVDHLLVVAVDRAAYERCRFLRLRCYLLPPPADGGGGGGGEKIYMSREFVAMMWRRTEFLGDVLRRGYSFVFTDTDVLWLRNPLPILTTHNPSPDLQISTDNFNGDESSDKNPINTGFYMVRSNNRTIALFESWYARKDHSAGMKEQDVLERMMREGEFRKLALRVRFLDTLHFSGFCQGSRDIRVVSTVHANCCRTIAAKIGDLVTVVGKWKEYRKDTASFNDTSVLASVHHSMCANSWH